MDFKEICGAEQEVWFTLSDKKKQGKAFLQWAKSCGCVWSNGKEIDPSCGTDFFTLGISSDGKLFNVPAMALASQQYKSVRRMRFADFCAEHKRGK